MNCAPDVVVSKSSDVDYKVANVRRWATGEAYASGAVTVTVRVYDPTGTTALTGAINAPWEAAASAFVAPIPPLGAGYATVLIRETVVAGGRTLVTDVSVTVVP